MQILNACLPFRPAAFQYGNGSTDNFISSPSKNLLLLECRVAALNGLVPAQQRNADRRGIQNCLQFGSGPPQFGGQFRHLHFQFIAGLA